MLNFEKDNAMSDDEIEEFLKTPEANLQNIEKVAKEHENYEALMKAQHVEYKEIDLESPSLFRYFINELPEINKAINMIEKGDYSRIEDVKCALELINTHVKMIASCMKKINDDFEIVKIKAKQKMQENQDVCLEEIKYMSDKTDDIVELMDIEM